MAIMYNINLKNDCEFKEVGSDIFKKTNDILNQDMRNMNKLFLKEYPGQIVRIDFGEGYFLELVKFDNVLYVPELRREMKHKIVDILTKKNIGIIKSYKINTVPLGANAPMIQIRNSNDVLKLVNKKASKCSHTHSNDLYECGCVEGIEKIKERHYENRTFDFGTETNNIKNMVYSILSYEISASVDFETIRMNVPVYVGQRARQDYLTQYSVTIINNGKITKYNDIMEPTEEGNTRLLINFLKLMRRLYKSEAVFLSYNKSYEAKVLSNSFAMIDKFPQLEDIYYTFAETITYFNNNTIDPMDIVKKDTNVGNSLKDAAEILTFNIPNYTGYQNIGIKNGLDMTKKYQEYVRSKSEIPEDIKTEMIKYCQKDTTIIFDLLYFLAGVKYTI